MLYNIKIAIISHLVKKQKKCYSKNDKIGGLA